VGADNAHPSDTGCINQLGVPESPNTSDLQWKGFLCPGQISAEAGLVWSTLSSPLRGSTPISAGVTYDRKR